MAAKSKSDRKRNKLLDARSAKRQAVLAKNPPKADAAMRLNPAYGYSLGDDGETLVANDAEAAVLTRMRELAARHLHTRDIAAKLTSEELDCRGTKWDAKLVAKVLRRKVTQPPGQRPQR